MFKDRVEIGKILVRFSDSSILNVMQGGGLTYAFIEKEKRRIKKPQKKRKVRKIS
jgi:hypothetical protein